MVHTTNPVVKKIEQSNSFIELHCRTISTMPIPHSCAMLIRWRTNNHRSVIQRRLLRVSLFLMHTLLKPLNQIAESQPVACHESQRKSQIPSYTSILPMCWQIVDETLTRFLVSSQHVYICIGICTHVSEFQKSGTVFVKFYSNWVFNVKQSLEAVSIFTHVMKSWGLATPRLQNFYIIVHNHEECPFDFLLP